MFKLKLIHFNQHLCGIYETRKKEIIALALKNFVIFEKSGKPFSQNIF
jgi:hypothetical protein